MKRYSGGVVAAIAGIGEDAPEADADLPLQDGDDGGQRVAVVRVAGQGLDVGDELAALRAHQRRRHARIARRLR